MIVICTRCIKPTKNTIGTFCGACCVELKEVAFEILSRGFATLAARFKTAAARLKELGLA